MKMNPLVTCPFNKNHKIMMSRLQGHISKCMKNHSKTGPIICPYNSEHHVDASKISEHCIICPDIIDVLMPADICNKKSSSSNNDIFATLTSGFNFEVEMRKNNTSRSSNNTKTVENKQLEMENQKSYMMMNPFVICPFDKNHRIEMGKYQNHFEKCKIKHSVIADPTHPLKDQHINENSQILHNDGHPSMTKLSIQANINKNKDDVPDENVSSMWSAYQLAAYHSTTRIREKNITCSHDNSKIIVQSQLEKKPKPLRRPASEKLRTSEFEKLIKMPYVQDNGIPKTDKNSYEVVIGMTTNSESHHTITGDTNSKNLNSYFCDQVKSLAKTDIDFEGLCQKLSILQGKEIAIAKDMQILRQKEKEIREEKKEIIKIFKNIVLLTANDNNNN